MKTVAKIVLGLLGSAVLTALLLIFTGVHNPYTDRLAAWISSAAGTGTSAGSQPEQEKTRDEAVTGPSTGAGEHQLLYQTETESGNTGADARQDSQTAAQDKLSAGYAEPAGETEESQGQESQARETQGQEPQETVGQTRVTYEFQTVDDCYFDDALFIGDSRTVGMQQSGLLPNAVYYAKTGIGIGDILNQRIVYEGGAMLSVKEALKLHGGAFGKVYIMIGINDMSAGGVDWFLQQYGEILSVIRQTQPQAVIYIQGNIPMSCAAQDYGGSLNNENLRQRNGASEGLADSRQIFYLDIASVYADEGGNLAGIYTTDGLHVQSKYYDMWVNYLKGHAVVK